MERIYFGPFELDAQRLLLSVDGRTLPLGPKVVETLLALARCPGELRSKQELIACVWPEGYVDEASLSQNIYVLRRTMRAYWDEEVIATVTRRGYRFVAPTRGSDQAPRPLPNAPHNLPWRRRLPVAASVALMLVVLVAVARLSVQPSEAQGVGLPPSARRLYAIGRYYWNKRTDAGLDKSLSYFHQVVDLAPRDARGYEALASAEAMLGDYGFGHASAARHFARAAADAHVALKLDGHAGEADAALGAIALDRNQRARAKRLLERAVTLAPRDAPAHEWLGILRLAEGQAASGYRELRRAADLDPLSNATAAWLAQAAYFDRRFHRAIAYAKQTLDLDPARSDVLTTLGLAQEALGERTAAARTFHRFAATCARCRSEAAALLADLYAREGRVTPARRELLLASAHAKDVERDDLAFALAALGERRGALAVLAHTSPATHVAFTMDPRFDALRDVAGFRSVARISS